MTLFPFHCSSFALFFLLLLTLLFSTTPQAADAWTLYCKRPSVSKPPLFSLPPVFAGIFYPLHWINAALTAHSAGWGVNICWWEAAWLPGSRPCGCWQEPRKTKKTNKLWFKLWGFICFQYQSVYLKSANKHHMLWKFSFSSQLWCSSFNNYKKGKQTHYRKVFTALLWKLGRGLFWNRKRELSFYAFGRQYGYWVNPPGTALKAGVYLAIVF